MILAHEAHWWWPFLWLVWIAVIGTIVWLIVRHGGWRRHNPLGGAKSILAERYARGEIEADEYRDRLARLG